MPVLDAKDFFGTNQKPTEAPGPVKAEDFFGEPIKPESLSSKIQSGIQDIGNVPMSVVVGTLEPVAESIARAFGDKPAGTVKELASKVQPNTDFGKLILKGMSLPFDVVGNAIKKSLMAMGRTEKEADERVTGIMAGFALGGLVKGMTKSAPNVGPIDRSAFPELTEQEKAGGYEQAAQSFDKRSGEPIATVRPKVHTSWFENLEPSEKAKATGAAMDEAAKLMESEKEQRIQQLSSIAPEGEIAEHAGKYKATDGTMKPWEELTDAEKSDYVPPSGVPRGNIVMEPTESTVNASETTSEAGQPQGPTVVNKVKDFISESEKQVKYSGSLLDDYYKIKGADAADTNRMRHVLENSKGSPADYEAIYNHLENPSEPLTETQRNLLETEIEPIRRAREKVYSRLQGEEIPISGEGYTPAQGSQTGWLVRPDHAGFPGHPGRVDSQQVIGRIEASYHDGC